MYLQTWKNTYWFLKFIPGSFDIVASLCMGFHRERAAAGLGPRGFKLRTLYMDAALGWICLSFSDWLRRWRKRHQRGRRKWKLWQRNLSVTGLPNTMTSPFSLVSTKTWTAAAACCSLSSTTKKYILLRCPNTVDKMLQSAHFLFTT